MNPEDALTTRLLGDAPPPLPPPEPPSAGWIWLIPIIGLLLVAAAWMTRFRLAVAPSGAIRVIGKSVVHPQATLVLVDVEDGGGGSRRMLLSTGSGGATLLADLGDRDVVMDRVTEAREPTAAATGALEPGRPAVSEAVRAVGLATSPIGTYAAMGGAPAGRAPRALDAAEVRERRDAALALLDEVADQRRGGSSG